MGELVVTGSEPLERCRICWECNTPFPRHQLEAYLRHVDRCGKAGDPEQQAHLEQRASNPLLSAADKEYNRWVRKHGRIK